MFTSFFLRKLNRKAAAERSRPRQIIEALRLCSGLQVADIGSGGGYFTLAFARIVGREGQVYAVDANQKYLDFVRRQAEREGFQNISCVLASDSAPGLPTSEIDLAFARNVFHHLKEPGVYFRQLRESLKTGGKLAVIDHLPKKGFGFVRFAGHHSSPETIGKVLAEAGFRPAKSFDFLPTQSFGVFIAD